MLKLTNFSNEIKECEESESRTLKSESRSLKIESRTLKSESRTLKSESRTLKSESRTLKIQSKHMTPHGHRINQIKVIESRKFLRIG